MCFSFRVAPKSSFWSTMNDCLRFTNTLNPRTDIHGGTLSACHFFSSPFRCGLARNLPCSHSARLVPSLLTFIPRFHLQTEPFACSISCKGSEPRPHVCCSDIQL
ncbi:hypothetical protein AVEN_95772-1 [Araneus ventricosus]|uniref:Uncharacterized protein n=1 Tax=Araneus ventricosus TaxID=182803 RepID=A0A4Y2GLX7_ARAVE|nr:hypothetical protein AVEN_95772-1 [Araneus ventricosus]